MNENKLPALLGDCQGQYPGNKHKLAETEYRFDTVVAWSKTNPPN